MNVRLTDDAVRVELSLYEKIGGLNGDLTIPYDRITAAYVDPKPLKSIRGRLKMGLRIPGYHYVCRTGAGHHFWALKGGAPALRLALDNGWTRDLTVSTPEPERLAREISRRAPRLR